MIQFFLDDTFSNYFTLENNSHSKEWKSLPPRVFALTQDYIAEILGPIAPN